MRVPKRTSLEEARVAETLKKGSRVTGAAREKLAADLKKKYDSGASIRALAEGGRLLPGQVRVVVLRGEGVSFSAGLDRQAFTPEGFDGEPSFLDLAHGSAAELDAAIAGYQEAFTWWRRTDLITVAAV